MRELIAMLTQPGFQLDEQRQASLPTHEQSIFSAQPQYADMYNEAYGNSEPEPVSELVPYMLEGFLSNDKVFARERKKKSGAVSATSGPVVPVARRTA